MSKLVERLNDSMYRFQRGPRTKPKAVHSDRVWNYRGEDLADWFQGHLQNQSEDVFRRMPTRQENLEVNANGGAHIRHPKKRQKLPP